MGVQMMYVYESGYPKGPYRYNGNYIDGEYEVVEPAAGQLPAPEVEDASKSMSVSKDSPHDNE